MYYNAYSPKLHEIMMVHCYLATKILIKNKSTRKGLWLPSQLSPGDLNHNLIEITGSGVCVLLCVGIRN